MKSDIREYKGYRLYKGYPALNAAQCWICNKICSNETIYAKTLKEAKLKIDEKEDK